MPYVKAMLQAAEPKPEYVDKESHLLVCENTLFMEPLEIIIPS